MTHSTGPTTRGVGRISTCIANRKEGAGRQGGGWEGGGRDGGGMRGGKGGREKGSEREVGRKGVRGR